MRPSFKLWLSVAAAVALVSCSRCGKPSELQPPELTKLLPADADAVLVIGDLRVLGERIALLERLKVASFAAQLQGLKDAKEYTGVLMGQLGVDLRSPAELEKAGIEPSGGLAVVLLRNERAYTVLSVRDEGKFKEFLQRIASTRLGAGAVSTRTEGGTSITSFARADGQPPVLAYLVKSGFAFLAAGASVAELPAFAAVTADRSLFASPGLTAALARLPAKKDLFIHLPPASTISQMGRLAGATLCASLNETGLKLVADLPWTGGKEALELLKKQPAPELLGDLPKEAFLVARFSGAPALLAPYWKQLVGPYLERAFTQASFDMKAEVLDNLEPGSTVAISLSPEVNLSAGVPAFDVRRTNPFRYVQLAGVAPVKDASKAAATLEKLPAIAPRFGAQITRTEINGRPVYQTSYAQGEGVHFAAVEKKVVFGSPLSRLNELVLRAAESKKPDEGPLAEASLRGVFKDRAAAVAIDLRRLAQSVRELPALAWGLGGFAIKATTVRWLEATEDLRAITVGFDSKEGAIQAEAVLALSFAKAEGDQK